MQRAQNSTASFGGRHEPLFADLGDALRPHASPRVLSFGCSIGWEVLDLARHLPGAEILGCDVSEAALREARERCPPEIEIFASSAEQLRAHAPFHAITVMNVLCRYPPHDPEDLSGSFPFSQFDATISMLAEALRPGGILVLYNAQYLLEDSSVASAFAPVPPARHRKNGWLEKYERLAADHARDRYVAGVERSAERVACGDQA